jgi:hypothetical protein
MIKKGDYVKFDNGGQFPQYANVLSVSSDHAVLSFNQDGAIKTKTLPLEEIVKIGNK